MSASKLWQQRATHVRNIRSSGIPMADELAAALDKALASAERRAKAAPGNARAYGYRVEQGVRRAVGELPAGSVTLGRWNLPRQVLNWIALKGPEAFGLRCLPDIRVVRRVLRDMEAERRRKMGIATLQCVECADHASDHCASLNNPMPRDEHDR